jgi:hypothetical protein
MPLTNKCMHGYMYMDKNKARFKHEHIDGNNFPLCYTVTDNIVQNEGKAPLSLFK